LGSHDLLAGVQYRHSSLSQAINGDRSDKQASDLGLYLQGDLHPRADLETVLGVRLDRHASRDELTGGEYETTAVNPRVGLRYSPHADVTVRVSTGVGFRVPYVFSEDLHLCASAPRIYKGKDLEAERALNASLGVDVYRIDYRLGLSAFRTVIDDKVEFVSATDGQIPEGYEYQWRNLGGASSQGIEVTCGGTAGRWLDYSASVVYTDATFDEPRFDRQSFPGDGDGWKHSNRIPRSPRWTGGLSTTLKRAGWALSSSANYTGAMYIDHVPADSPQQLEIEKTPGFVLVDARLTKAVTENATAYMGAKNLLGYTQPTRDRSDAAYIYAPLYGRTLYSGFELAIR
jgi:outer membrane receptor for ferrienterochelin and colicins